MKGEVVEGKKLKEAYEMLMHQPVGAKLHVFTPEIDLVGEGIYSGPSSDGSHYVGLRDVIIVAVRKIEGETVANVKICYKKKVTFISVDLRTMFMRLPHNGDDSQLIKPTGLLIDFCVPRLSIN